ncbi:odorant receptor 131-2-like [Eleginops maclovinus]|uniref:odorant receptor 131-2-like n=1 Tax=Eleginops maclovinus TaxID=56733 RepID=UPI0030809210
MCFVDLEKRMTRFPREILWEMLREYGHSLDLFAAECEAAGMKISTSKSEAMCNFVTPITLTVMTLERYVAICMPLRHGELCSMRNTVHCILIILVFSAVPCIVVLSIFLASAPPYFFTQDKICSMELFVVFQWQGHIKLAVFQFYFLIMSVTIFSSYIGIVKVVKAASGENKKSKWKGLRTVILHAFQLLLCLIYLWCPFIEAAILPINLVLYINVRYNNYIICILSPRCLSPLISGLRDTIVSHAVKGFAFFGLYKKSSHCNSNID